MTETADPAEVVRTLIAGMSNEAIHSGVDALVRGIIQGIADEVADRVVETIVERIHNAAAAVESPATEPETEPAPATEPPPPRSSQDANQRTCELCGRIGSRRFEETPTGWRCSPTAKCSGRPDPTPPAIAVAAPPKRLAATPHRKAEPPPIPAVPPPTPGVTARCQDCPRTWTLAGRVLELAVQTHELQRGHIVTVVGEVVP